MPSEQEALNENEIAPEAASEVSPEELAWNNALAAVFEDVRSQSAASALVTPKRWVEQGLVPDRMTPEDFEMAVYDYLQDLKAAQEDESRTAQGGQAQGEAASCTATPDAGAAGSGASEAARAGVLDAQASSAQASAAAKPAGLEVATSAPGTSGSPLAAASENAHLTSPYASRSVGVPRLFASPDAKPPRMPETKRSIEPPRPKPADGGLNIPEGFELVEMEGEWVLVETGEASSEPACVEVNAEGIQVLVGARSYYLYSSAHMTDAYAHWAFLAAEDNPLVTFADCVREDSRIYPRPMARESFANPPFRMSAQDVEAAWAQAQKLPDYADVKRIEASNGDVYFYSATYLSEPRAKALAEWDAVERYMNV